MANKYGREKIGAVLFWLMVWQICSIWIGQEILLVSPVAVCKTLWNLIQEISFWQSIVYSGWRIMGGFLLAVCLGVIAAAYAAKYRALENLLQPLVAAIKATPVASFIILALVWVSSANLSVLIAFLMGFPVVYTNLLQGFWNADKQIWEMICLLGVRHKIRYYWFVQLFPYLRAAIATAIGLCWKAGIAAEVIGMPEGSMGERLQEAKVYLQMPSLFAWTVAIVAVSVCIEKLILFLLVWLERKNKGQVVS